MSPPDNPTLVKRNENVAEAAMIRRSAASAITAPAPAATPLTEAMMGRGQSRIRCVTLPVIRVKASKSRASIFWSSPMISVTSPPELKPRPVPVMTSTLTSSRCGRSVSRSRRSAYTWNVKAFSFWGRSKVTVAIPSSTAKRKWFHDCVGVADPRNAVIRKNLSSPPKERRIHEHRGRPADLYGRNQRGAPLRVGEARRRRSVQQFGGGGPRRLPELRALHRAGRRRRDYPAGAAGHHGRDRAASQYRHPGEAGSLAGRALGRPAHPRPGGWRPR